MKIVKKVGLGFITVGAMLFMSACSSSSSSSDDTLSGYYLDSAVKGVDYACGDRNGITDSEGKFRFLKGDSCKFSLAGITLREMAAEELNDGAKIIETVTDVLVFLQSIDKDGNASNGIDIDEAVVEVIQTLVEENNVTTVPTGTTLTTVVETLTQEVEDYNGTVVSEDDALAHVKETQEELIREAIASKTYWLVGKDTAGYFFDSLTFDENATSYTTTEDGVTRTESFTIDGDKVIFSDGTYAVVTLYDGYFKSVSYNADGTLDTSNLIPTLFYLSEADAKAYYDSLIGESEIDLVALLASKTYWIVGKDRDGAFIDSLTFNADASTYTALDEGEEVTVSISIDGNKVTEVDSGKYYILTQKDGYLESVAYNADGSLDSYELIPTRFYLSEDAARAYYNTL